MFEFHGNTLRCCRRKLNVGPHYFCNLIAWVLILGVTLAFQVLCGYRLHWSVVLITSISGLALVVAFALTTLLDPGYLERGTPEQLEKRKQELERTSALEAAAHTLGSNIIDPMLNFTPCTKCHVMREERGTQHCYDCDLCCRELDHHCPWSGKCIGKGNMLAFKSFLGLLLTHCIITGAVSITGLGILWMWHCLLLFFFLPHLDCL